MKKLTIGLLVIGVAGAGFLAWNASQEKPIEVELANVQRGDVRATVSNTRAGTINTCNRARMSPILGGQIASLPVAEGDSVKKGDVLLELWNVDVRAQLALATSELASTKANSVAACTASQIANREAERYEKLYDQQLISEERADIVFGDAEAKRAACSASRNMISVGNSNVALVEAYLERTILRAPFAGTVAEINGEVGEIVTASPVGVATLPAIDLIDTSCTYVTAPIDEIDAPEIRAGMAASISLDAFPNTSFPATVRRVAPYVRDMEKQARTVDIDVEFDESSASLLPGYSADVEVVLEVQRDVLFVPTQAMVDASTVYVLNANGEIEERTVEIGIRNWQETEITNGLTDGELIILSIEREGVAAGAAAVVAEQ